MVTRRHFTTTTVLISLMALGITAVQALPDPSPPRMAFIARADGTNFADALAVGSVAGQLGAPVFTTARDSLPESTAQGLDDYEPEMVVIAGGTAAVSDAVRLAIMDVTNLSSDKVLRAAGSNRFGTAVAIADLLSNYDAAFLPVGARAVDADLLDGLDSTAFVRTSDSIDADTLGGMSDTQIVDTARSDTLWATVDVDTAGPTLLSGKGVTGVSQFIEAGRTRVDLDRDVTGCAVVASASNDGGSSGVMPGYATATEYGTWLLIETRTDAGTYLYSDISGFNVIVTC